MPKVTQLVSGRTGTQNPVCLTQGLLCTQEEKPEGPAAHCCQGTGLPAPLRVSAFPTRLVRLPCDSCPAWRLVTRTHRLMLVSPRKQKASQWGWGRCGRRSVGSGEG